MLKVFLKALPLLLLYQQVGGSFGVHWYQYALAPEVSCAPNNVKLLSLLNLLCNTTQTTSELLRDSCYGCFFRAGNMVNAQAQLSALSGCANLYISQTAYGTCALNLQIVVDGRRAAETEATTGLCYSVYCEFVRCIRRINAQQLIATCFEQSLGNRELEDDIDRINFYTNVTSCILARTRCSQYNPITGELQQQYSSASQSVATKKITAAATAANYAWIGRPFDVQPPYFNALQVSQTGEIRIIKFPKASTSVGDLFCSRLPTLQQAGYGPYNC